VHRDLARVAAPAVLPQGDALPGAQGEPAVDDGDRELRRRERAAHMGRHVVHAFLAVQEERVAVAHQPGEEALEVVAHLRVGVLLHQQAGRGVAHEERQQALADAAVGDARALRP
jgi:hypothetical protein